MKPARLRRESHTGTRVMTSPEVIFTIYRRSTAEPYQILKSLIFLRGPHDRLPSDHRTFLQVKLGPVSASHDQCQCQCLPVPACGVIYTLIGFLKHFKGSVYRTITQNYPICVRGHCAKYYEEYHPCDTYWCFQFARHAWYHRFAVASQRIL